MVALSALQRKALDEVLKGLQDLDLNRIVRESDEVLERQLATTFPDLDAKVRTAIVSTVSKTGYSTATEIARAVNGIATWIKVLLEDK